MTRSPIMPSLVSGARATLLSLFGGTIAGVVVGDVVFNLAPGHDLNNPGPIQIAIAAIPALTGFVLGGAWWGILMGRIAHAGDRRRMALAGALGFAPSALAMGLTLSLLEPIAVENLGAQFPIHRLFTFLFVPAVFIVAGVSAGAIGLGVADLRLAFRLLWQVGLAGGLAFLVVNLMMEMLGWQVGAPHAAERATMVTVASAGVLGAAIAGGAVMGRVLEQYGARRKG